MSINADRRLPDAPVANADAYAVGEDTTLNVTGTAMLPSVLANDTDAENQVLTGGWRASGPANGTLALNPNGTFDYTPHLNFNGPDSFTYRASDGTASKRGRDGDDHGGCGQ